MYSSFKNIILFSFLFLSQSIIAQTDGIYTNLFVSDADFYREIDVTRPVGFTRGVHGVSPTGGGTYNIPINALPGINGMEPNISITYSSQSSTGICGYGWDISGLSAISRTGQNIFSDGRVKPISFNSSEDRFALDGQRLTKIGGTYGNSGVYKTEMEDFSRVIASGTPGSSVNSYFKVETKDGMTIWYGYDDPNLTHVSNSKILDASGTKVISWNISKTMDKNGNYILYEYDNDLNENRIARIKYTGNSNAGRTTFQSIAFEYAQRSDKNELFIAGTSFKQRHILSNIYLKNHDQILKTYALTYGEGTYSHLQEVTETDFDGNELNSTRFKYDSPSFTTFYPTPYNTLFSDSSEENVASGNVKLVTGDFNGDGYTDIIRRVGNISDCFDEEEDFFSGCFESFNLYLNNGGEFEFSEIIEIDGPTFLAEKIAPNVYSPSRSSIVADFDGNGDDEMFLLSAHFVDQGSMLNDLLTISSFNVVDYVNGTGISQISIAPPAGFGRMNTPSKNMAIADFNGDGQADVFAVLRQSSGSGVKAFMITPSSSTVWTEISNMDFTTINTIMPVNFDGDAKSELMILEEMPDNHRKVFSFEGNFSNQGTIAQSLVYDVDYWNDQHNIFAGDFNGDGLTDLFSFSDNGKQIAFATGDGYINSDLNETINSNNFYIYDVDRDGKSDIVSISNENYNSPPDPDVNLHTKVKVLHSKGKSFTSETKIFNGIIFSSTLLLGDFNSDGKNTLFSPFNIPFEKQWWNYECTGIYDEIAPLGGCFYTYSIVAPSFYLNYDQQPPRLRKVLDGFNKETHYTYKYISQDEDFQQGNTSVFPIMDFIGPIMVVDKISISNGVGGLTSSSYDYEEAQIHLEGKGFLGFKKLFVKDDITGTITKTSTTLDPQYFTPSSSSTKVFSNQNNLLSQSNTLYESVSLSNGRYWNRMTQSDEKNYITGESQKTTINQYDNFGNIKMQTTNFGNGIRGLVERYNNFVNAGSWIPSYPTIMENRLSASEETDYVRTSTFNYDGNGQVTTQVLDPNTERPVTTQFSYNSFGLVTSEEISSPATSEYTTLPTKTKTTAYDDYGYPTIVTTTGNDSKKYSYNPGLGLLNWEKDISGHTTSYIYDNLGNLFQSIDPLGNISQLEYYWDVQSGSNSPTSIGRSTFYTKIKNDGGTENRTSYDELGRTVLKETVGFNGKVIKTITNYNELGQIKSETSPFYSDQQNEAIINTFSYNPENQLPISTTNEIGTSTNSYELSGTLFKVTTTTLAGVSSSTYTDASGRIVKAQDQGGVVAHKFHANGKLKSTTVNDVITATMEYDNWGNKILFQDVNAGTINNKYNAYGQLYWQKNAKDQIKEISYDEKGRIENEINVEGNISFEYVTTANGKNKLKKIIGTDGSTKEYSYDQFSRIIREKENLANDDFSELITEFTFDNWGRIKTTKYPSNVISTNHYIEPDGIDRGRVSSVSAEGITIYEINEINAFGQIVEYSNGNGLVTTKDIDKFGLLNQKQVQGILDLSYTYDLSTGNMLLRQNNITQIRDNFTYDSMDRLTKVQTTNLNAPNLFIPPHITDYSQNGNITSNSNVGDYTYESDKINAVSSLSNVSPYFDADQQIITYTYFDKIKTLEESGKSLEFIYSPTQARKEVRLRDDQNNLIYKRIYGRQYEEYFNQEEAITHYITYLPGGAAHHKRDGFPDQFVYLHSDHQGSVIACSNEQGELVGSRSYSAWGQMQESTQNSMPIWLARGYTGHEHYEEFGLINMNGRVYNPQLGRMIQVDNFIQNPNSTQSHNRYSYVFNNPLKYNDPSGETPVAVFRAIGRSGMFLTDYLSNLIHGKSQPIKRAWKNSGRAFGFFSSILSVKVGDWKIVLDPISFKLKAKYTGSSAIGKIGSFVLNTVGKEVLTKVKLGSINGAANSASNIVLGDAEVIGQRIHKSLSEKLKMSMVEKVLFNAIAAIDNANSNTTKTVAKETYFSQARSRSGFMMTEKTLISGGGLSYGKFSITGMQGRGLPEHLEGTTQSTDYSLAANPSNGSEISLFTQMHGEIILVEVHSGSSITEIFGRTSYVQTVNVGAGFIWGWMNGYDSKGNLMWFADLRGSSFGGGVGGSQYPIKW